MMRGVGGKKRMREGGSAPLLVRGLPVTPLARLAAVVHRAAAGAPQPRWTLTNETYRAQHPRRGPLSSRNMILIAVVVSVVVIWCVQHVGAAVCRRHADLGQRLRRRQ